MWGHVTLLNRMGACVSTRLDRYGFYPAGGGRFSAEIEGGQKLSTLELPECGAVRKKRAVALLSQIPTQVGDRELKGLERKLDFDEDVCSLDVSKESPGPGNALMVFVKDEVLTELFTAFGERNLSSKRVAGQLADTVKAYLSAQVPVGWHLADQLPIPMLLAGGGSLSGPWPRHCIDCQILRLLSASSM